MVDIRKIEQQDNATLSHLIKKVFEEFGIAREGTVYTDPATDHLYELFDRPDAECWVAEENGTLLGSCGVYPTDGLPAGCAELVKLYLSPEARGKGVGSILIRNAIDRARQLGYNLLYLETFDELAKAVSLYYRLGFESIERPMGNSGHYATTIWMTKEL